MMLVDRISFTGHNSMVSVAVINDRIEVTIDMNQRIMLSIEQVRALQLALTRVVEGR